MAGRTGPVATAGPVRHTVCVFLGRRRVLRDAAGGHAALYSGDYCCRCHGTPAVQHAWCDCPVEPELRAERQMDGIRKARERGVPLGRKTALDPQQITALQHQRREGALIKTLMRDYT